MSNTLFSTFTIYYFILAPAPAGGGLFGSTPGECIVLCHVNYNFMQLILNINILYT